jgi:hypothetical protein
MISEYGEWLRSQTNRHGRPFQPETISAYRGAAVALSSGGRFRYSGYSVRWTMAAVS